LIGHLDWENENEGITLSEPVGNTTTGSDFIRKRL